jgi:S1-C subfamily serine protease
MRKPKQPFAPWWLRATGVLLIAAFVFIGISLASEPTDTRAPPAVRVNVSNGHGTGVHIGMGKVITAAHVVGDEKEVQLVTEDGKTVRASVLWVNKDFDVALLAAPDLVVKSTPPYCRDPFVGIAIQTTGNPLGLQFIRTWGRVASGVAARGPWARTFIADITVAGGVSGGPVYDMQQRLVGIVVGTAFQPMGLAGSFIPLTYVVPATAICGLLAR